MVRLSHDFVVKIPFVLLALSLLVVPAFAGAWNGEWTFVTSGPTEMHLDQSGTSVTGWYSGHKGTVSGSTTNSIPPVFTGTWRWENGDTGTIEFRMSQDYLYFDCLWGYNADPRTITCAGFRPQGTGPGSISVTSSPSGAQVYVDSIYGWGKTPTIASDITPGSHTVSLSLAGYNAYTETVTVTSGQRYILNVQLQPSTPSTGSLSISSTPSGAAVIVDGVSQGTTPTTVQGLAAGSHTVRVTMSGYSDYEGTAAVTAGGTTPVTVSLSPLAAAPPAGAPPAGSSGTAGSQSGSTGTGSIEVRSQPSGATITFDGSQKGVTPAKLTNVKTGSHELKLTLSGYPEWKQTVTVKTGETASINAVLGTSTQTTGGQSAASGTGSLSVATEPTGAQVYVDGAFIGNSPTKTSGLTAGSHFLTFKKEGYLDLGVGVIITAGQTTEYSTSLVSNPAGVNKRTPGFATVLGILAIACLVAGRRLYDR